MIMHLKNGLLLVVLLLFTTLAFGQMNEQEQARLKAYSAELAARSARDQATLEATAHRLNIPLTKVVGDRLLTLTAIDKGVPEYSASYNVVSQQTASADQVKMGGTLSLNLTGVGVRLGVWEAFDANSNANVRTSHDEFDGRATSIDGGGFSNHATHVAGTMIAAGVDPLAQGFAMAADLDCYDISSDLSEMATAAAAADPIVASNHSYGSVVGWDFDNTTMMWQYLGPGGSTEDWRFGAYTSATQDWDQTAFNATHLLIVKSAGNDRGDGPGPPGPGMAELDGGADGFDCIPTYGNAKNILTVGASRPNTFGNYTNPADVIITSFSGWGPTDDGRVKPDIVADGSQLYSSRAAADDDYGFSSGTSMSSPSVTGGTGLLYEHWNTVLGGTPRAATMKALLLESADEAGPSDGPDYTFDWGLMNVADAAQLITVEGYQGCDQYYEGSLGDDETYSFTVSSTGDQPLKFTLVWHDPASGNTNGGTLNPATSNLVNDLDLRVTHNGTTFMPWRLDPANTGNAATRGNNFRDNVEQVLILPPDAGTYTVTIDAPATVSNGPQTFSLWWLGTTATDDEVLVNNITFPAGTSETYAANLRVLFADGPAPGTVTINPGAAVEGFGGEEVRLRPGFHAQAGCHFLGRIMAGGGCGEFTGDMKRDNYPGLGPAMTAAAPSGPAANVEAKLSTVPAPTLPLTLAPNPTTDQLTVSYRLEAEASVRVLVYNQFGQLMTPVAPAQVLAAGPHKTRLDCSNWPAGLYHLVLQTGQDNQRQAFVVTR